MGLGPDLASERYQGTFLTRRAQRVQLGHDGAGTHRPQGQQGTSSQIGQGEGCPGLCLGDDIVPITVAHQVPEDLRTYTELGIIQEVVAQPQEIRMLGGRECGERPRDGAPLAHIIGEETSAVAIDGRWRHVEGAGSERPLSELQRQVWAILPHLSPCLGRQADHLSSLRAPDTSPHPLPDVLSTRTSFYNYPAGVRIISGLALAVLVTEAPADSGALITTRFAAEQGRDVLAVPGNITARSSYGTNKLIQDGARLVLETADVLAELNLHLVPQQLAQFELLPENATEGRLLDLLAASGEPLHADELCRASGLPISEISGTLVMLELKGLVRQLAPMAYARA